MDVLVENFTRGESESAKNEIATGKIALLRSLFDEFVCFRSCFGTICVACIRRKPRVEKGELITSDDASNSS